MAARERGLTPGEIELLREVFGNRLSYERIRLRDGAGSNALAVLALRNPDNWAMTYLNTVHFNRGRFSEDFSARGEDDRLLVHEATHVWQYSKLGLLPFAVRYGWNFASCRFDQHAMYQYNDQTAFASAGLEAQASMVEHSWIDRGKPEGEALKRRLAGSGLWPG